jgi:hypothetical protein
MILVIYPKSDLSTQNFISYLIQKNIAHVALDIDRDILKSEIIIKDNITECTWSWSQTDLIIKFNSLTGIYNRVYALDYVSFFDYCDEDIEYVQGEWWAYLLYILKSSTNCINPPSCELLSGRALDFTYFYNLAKKIGLKVPEYFVSTSYLELKSIFENGKEYIALKSLFLNNKFLASKDLSERDIALIEHVKGKLILVHVIKKNFYCCVLEKDKKYSVVLSHEHQILILELKAKLNLEVIQLFMIQTLDDVYLLNVSLFPNWDFNTVENKEKIFSDLVKILSQNQNLK